MISEKTTIGTIDLYDFDPYNKRAGVGILIAEKKNRQKGYASEALNLLTNYAFDFLHMKQLFCEIDESNLESFKLFKNKRFSVSGKKKMWKYINGKWCDVLFLQLINY